MSDASRARRRARRADAVAVTMGTVCDGCGVPLWPIREHGRCDGCIAANKRAAAEALAHCAAVRAQYGIVDDMPLCPDDCDDPEHGHR